jgi:hypothetical protein
VPESAGLVTLSTPKAASNSLNIVRLAPTNGSKLAGKKRLTASQNILKKIAMPTLLRKTPTASRSTAGSPPGCCASASSNETGYLTQKFTRALGMLAVDNQARV